MMILKYFFLVYLLPINSYLMMKNIKWYTLVLACSCWAANGLAQQVPFSTPSDGRFKYQVKEDVKGLDFILQLRPVTYQLDAKRFDEQLRGKNNMSDSYGLPDSSAYRLQMDRARESGYTEASSIRRSGFIGQEVEKAANASGYNFSGLRIPQKEKEYYSLSYETFVVPLVKAIQEQQKIIADLQKQINALKQQRGTVTVTGVQRR
jgi:hypothetical protein